MKRYIILLIIKNLFVCLLAMASFGFLSQSSYAELNKENNSKIELPDTIPRARWGEGWFLYDPELLRDYPLLYLKNIPLNKSGESNLSLGGEYRFTYELYDPADRGLTNTGKSDVVLNRIALHADWHIDKNWRVFGQLGAAFAGDREGGNKVGDETALNIWQLFVEGNYPVNNSDRLKFRLGRQFIEKANWFIGAGEAPNVRQYYDGIRLVVQEKDFLKFDAYISEFVDISTEQFDMKGNGEYFWGTSASIHIEPSRLNLTFYYLGWSLKDREFQQGNGSLYDETRHSLLLWLNKAVRFDKNWALDYYLVYQFGQYEDSRNSNINAYSAFGELKYAFYAKEETPIVGLKLSYFSGDNDPDDNQLNTFYNPIFVTPYFTYARDVRPYNLIHIQPNISYRFSRRLTLALSTDFLWRASKNDAFYTGANKIGVDARASDASFIGTQSQIAINWKPTRNIVNALHLVHYSSGDVVSDAGGTDQNYMHFGFNFLF